MGKYWPGVRSPWDRGSTGVGMVPSKTGEKSQEFIHRLICWNCRSMLEQRKRPSKPRSASSSVPGTHRGPYDRLRRGRGARRGPAGAPGRGGGGGGGPRGGAGGGGGGLFWGVGDEVRRGKGPP